MHHPSLFNTFRWFLYVSGSVSFLPLVLGKGIDSPVLNDDTEAFIHQALKNYSSPGGVGVAVVRMDSAGSWQIETKGYGIANLANGSKVTENTRFAIGSNSKLFDVIATGILIHNETLTPRLTWTSKLASVIPGFGLEDSVAFQQANIIDAMSHRTGLPRHDVSYKLSDNMTTLIAKIKHQRPSAEFREVWQYNNNMYSILSYLPTALLPSKISFARYVKEHILDPLGMTSTTYSPFVAGANGQLADGMGRQFIDTGGVPFIPRAIPYFHPDNEDGSITSGPGGLISSPVDMATWLQTLLLQGVNPKTNTSVIPADVVEVAATGFTVVSGAAGSPELSPVIYGGGQTRGTYRGHEYISHDGSVPGFYSQVFRLPWDNVGLAILTNDQELGSVIAQIITFRLLDEALSLEPIDWNARLGDLQGPSTPPTPRPTNASFPFDNFSSVTGKYYDPGYGEFELCLALPDDSRASPSCKALAANISTVLPGATPSDIPTFFTEWNHASFTHIRLTHFNGPLFNLSAFASYPTGNASVPFWSADLGIADAYALVDDELSGMGFFGVWGPTSSVPEHQGNSIRERAEVWFDRSSS